MVKNIKLLLGVLFLCMLYGGSKVSAQKNTEQQTDAEAITAQQKDSDTITAYHADEYHNIFFGTKDADYLFTEKSSGKILPLQIKEDGVMFYCFSSDKIELLDDRKKVIQGKTDKETMSYNYDAKIYERVISVRKDKKYYIHIPEMNKDEINGITVKVFPTIKTIEQGKDYMIDGKGRYAYYSFTVKKKSLAALYVNPMFMTEDKLLFKVQKKVKGKWKDITSVRSKLAYSGQLGELAPYGLSKGKYRFGVKIKKGQLAWICSDIRGVKYKNAVKKSKAVQLKKSKSQEGVFTWEDKKVHWYKVIRSKKNRIKKLNLYVGCAVDKVDFTVYKKGKSKPIKKVSVRGKNRIDHFMEYVCKSYTLKDNGTYYIKVSKANKKTNGAYKIGVK